MPDEATEIQEAAQRPRRCTSWRRDHAFGNDLRQCVRRLPFPTGAPARQPGDRWALPSGRGASEVAHEAVSDLLNGRDDEPESHDETAAANGDSMGNERGFRSYSV